MAAITVLDAQEGLHRTRATRVGVLRPAKGLADRVYDLSTHSTINREISARMSAACVSRGW